jgi:hypothetical protein
VWVGVGDWWSTLRYRSSDDDELYAEPGPIDRGTILCDYVDQDTLTSVATQLDIPVTPTRVEEDTRRSSGMTARFKGLGGDRRREAGRKEIRGPIDDPSVLVRQVLKVLNERDELNRRLDRVPSVDIYEGSVALGDPDEGTQVIDEWLAEQFPQRLNVTRHELAQGISTALTTALPRRRLVVVPEPVVHPGLLGG